MSTASLSQAGSSGGDAIEYERSTPSATGTVTNWPALKAKRGGSTSSRWASYTRGVSRTFAVQRAAYVSLAMRSSDRPRRPGVVPSPPTERTLPEGPRGRKAAAGDQRTEVSPRLAPPARPEGVLVPVPEPAPGAPGRVGDFGVLTTGPGTWRSPSALSPPSRRSVNEAPTSGAGAFPAAAAASVADAAPCRRGSTDRKSTRLHSRHLVTS